MKDSKHKPPLGAKICSHICPWTLSVAQSSRYFPQATFSKKCLLLGTDNVRRKISEHISVPRDHDLREHIPHTRASSNDNLFQSNFSAWSNCEAILVKTPSWPI